MSDNYRTHNVSYKLTVENDYSPSEKPFKTHLQIKSHLYKSQFFNLNQNINIRGMRLQQILQHDNIGRRDRPNRRFEAYLQSKSLNRHERKSIIMRMVHRKIGKNKGETFAKFDNRATQIIDFLKFLKTVDL